MRRFSPIASLFAVLLTACSGATIPAGMASEDAPATTAVADQGSAVPSAAVDPIETRTVTTGAVTEGPAPDLELLPPSPTVATSADASRYFFFREVAGAESFTATLVDITSDGTDAAEGVVQLRVDGATQQISSSDAVERTSWIISDTGAWVSDGTEWQAAAEVDHLIGLIAAAASPQQTYGALYAVADDLTFVGWQDRSGATLARYRGDAEAAALVLGLGQLDGVSASMLDVWIDPAGFFAAFDARIELESGAFREVRWAVTDINRTSIAPPG